MKDPLKKLKKIIVTASSKSGEGHIPSAFSVLDILWVLYDKVLKFNPKNPSDQKRDIFILSKGHASLGLYAVLAEKGFFPLSELENFGKFDSILGGHPDRNKVPGVEASTGSLGHGFPISIGVALGLKIKRSTSKVFVLIGDGECNEGTVWESALLASHHKLSNLYCVVDYNHSTDRALDMGDLAEKFKSFGWDTCVINGHDHAEIYNALIKSSDKPKAIIANTVKGYGSKTMENNPAWHHKSPSPEEFNTLLEELS
ncbi:MAG: transketolase [Patescibacteria group bacterium]